MKVFILLNLIFLSIKAHSQEITLSLGENIIIQEGYSAKNEGYTDHSVKLTLERNKQVLEKDIIVNIKTSDITTSSSDYKLLNSTLIFTYEEMNRNHKIEREVFFRIMKDSLKTDASDELFMISAGVDTNGRNLTYYKTDSMLVTIMDSKPPAQNLLYVNPFRITAGANFDFEAADPASFYFDAMAFHLERKNKVGDSDLWKSGFGFYGSLYKNRYLSKDSIQTSRDYHTLITAPAATVDLIRTRYQINVSSTIKNLGGEFGPMYGWSKVTDTTYTSHSIVVPEFSATLRNVGSTYSYTKIEEDTVFNTPMPDTLNHLIQKSFNNYKKDEFLLGVGYIFRHISKGAGEITFKASTGLAFQKGATDIYGFYSFRCQLLDPIVHANLGVEVRGYYKAANPYFGIYLSKSFTLKKLTEY